MMESITFFTETEKVNSFSIESIIDQQTRNVKENYHYFLQFIAKTSL